MTDPKYAIDTDHGRYYEHPNYPGRRFVSITNVLDSIAKPALVPAAVKITAETAVDLVPEIVASARVPECKPKRVADECGRCTPCMVKRIKRQHTNVWEHAADTGTLIHRVAEAHVTGAELSLSAEEWEQAQPYLDQYLKFLDDYEVNITQHVEAAELTVCHPELGLAGTLDVMLHLPLDGYIQGKVKRLTGGARSLWVVDLKTSMTKPVDTVYESYPLQLTAQRFAREAWLPDGSIIPMPKGIKGTAILNLRPDAYAFIPVPSGQAEWDAYQGFLTGTRWLHQDVHKTLRPVDPRGRTIPKPDRRKRKAA